MRRDEQIVEKIVEMEDLYCVCGTVECNGFEFKSIKIFNYCSTMAERPTPHSICICILIALYSDKSSPIYTIPSIITNDDKKKKEEEVEDYLSQVLIDFVVSNPEGWRNKNYETNNNNNNKKEEVPITINHVEKSSTRKFPIMSLSESCHFLFGTSIVGEEKEEWKEEMIQVWIKDLKDTCTSLNHFIDFFVALEQQTLIDKESILGIYIRQRCLGFNNLSFEASCQLYTCFSQHVQQPQSTIMEPPNINHPPQQQQCHNNYWPNSSQQVSRQLQQTISLSSTHQNNDEKEENDDDDDIYYYYKDYPELPLYHYLLFLFQQKKRKNHEEAMNQYHRYFDYGMIHQRKQRILTGGKDDNTNMFAYASIVLAYYYLQQNNDKNHEMIQLAIQEAIRVSQQSSNDTCLSFAITYLQYFQNQNKHTNNTSFLPSPSLSTTNTSSLMYHIHLLSSQQATTTTTTATMSHSLYPAASHPSWQYLAAAMTMNTTTTATTTDDGDDVVLLQNNPTNIESTNTSTLAKQLRIGLWEYFGHVNLSTFYTMLSNDNNNNNNKYVLEKQSMGIFYGSSIQRLQTKTNLRLQLQQTLSSQPKQPPPPSLLSLLDPQQSYYKKALDSISNNSNKQQKLHSRFVTSVQLEWSLQRTEIQKAFIHQFHLHNYRIPQQQTQSFLQTWNYTSQLLAKSGNVEQAYKTLQRNIATIKGTDTHDYVYHVEYTLQLIIILIRDGNLELFNMILVPMLMECVNICEQYSLHTWHSCALCLLGTVQYELGNVQDAMTILESTVPKLDQNAHIQYKQMAHFSLAKCHLKSSSFYDSSNYKQCLHHLQVCQTVLEKIQDYQLLQEVFYLQAHCYQSLLMSTTTTTTQQQEQQKQTYKRMRNQAAKQFSLLQRYSVSAKYNSNVREII